MNNREKSAVLCKQRRKLASSCYQTFIGIDSCSEFLGPPGSERLNKDGNEAPAGCGEGWNLKKYPTSMAERSTLHRQLACLLKV